MSNIVARMEKIKSESLDLIGKDKEGESHSAKGKGKSAPKYDLVDSKENYKEDIENFIKKNKSTKSSVRKDAVLINQWFISSDSDFFDDLSTKDIKKFFISAKEYFSKRFGEENIRYAIVNPNKPTPYMQIGIVPFDKNKKLSSTRIFDSKTISSVQEGLVKHFQEKGFDIDRLDRNKRKKQTSPKLKEEEKKIETMIEKEKEELVAHTKENKIGKIDILVKKEMKEVEVETNEKTFFGKNKTELIRKWTGNIILSEEDYLKMSTAIKKGIESQEKLSDILNTDIYKENLGLKKQIEEVTSSYKEYKDMVKDLKEENSKLKTTIKDFKK